MEATAIARVAHEANRALQLEQADPTIAVSPTWDDLDEEARESLIHGVLAVQDGATAEQSHEGWRAFKLARGWTLGPVKDTVLRQHPLLVPYAELPESQQLKDHLFGAIVAALTP